MLIGRRQSQPDVITLTIRREEAAQLLDAVEQRFEPGEFAFMRTHLGRFVRNEPDPMAEHLAQMERLTQRHQRQQFIGAVVAALLFSITSVLLSLLLF